MKSFGYLLAIIVSITAVLLLWGVVIEPRIIDEEQFTVGIPDLPPDWQQKEVAVIGDFQIGMWLENDSTIRRIVDELVERRPAAVLITGDFIYRPTGLSFFPWIDELDRPAAERRTERLIQENVDILRPLVEAGLPVYAAMGNHDYGQETKDAEALVWAADLLASTLESNGIEILQNEARELGTEFSDPAEPLYLVGIGAHYPGMDKPTEALEGLPANAPRLVLFHNPQTFPKIPAGAAPFAVAGHTHGGQIRIPMTESWSWLRIVEEGDVHADGWVEDPDFGAAGNRLYVNRGIGFSMIPVRVQCPPELTIFTLERENQSSSASRTSL
ncbi:metallophosphoesterase [Proteobacteria bacterium 005FR1]|nr:metallophosphoesterase [Proteobacteria bacterium 005FR1]